MPSEVGISALSDEMKLGIVTRRDEKEKWGGDLKAIYSIYEGLKEIGQEVVLGETARELKGVDLVFLSNTAVVLKDDFNDVQQRGQPFGIIGLHEDREKYYGPCYGFAHYLGLCLNQTLPFARLEQLLEQPEIVHYFSYASPSFFSENISILEHAKLCIANSTSEKQTLLRDSPECKAEVVYLECGIPDDLDRIDDSFLQWTGLKRGEYALQVGRMEPRKNQLATVLAMKDLDIPLVFIATKTKIYRPYENLVMEAIKRWRKAPTLVISQEYESAKEGNFQILTMPEKKILPFSMLLSAFQNAGLFVHPAFCELPGLVYLEAAKLGVPTIASDWAAVKDYFTDSATGKYTLDERIAYVQPHHIKDLEKLIPQQFGKKIAHPFSHPAFQRRKSDVAVDFLNAILKI